jgi:guanine deaminase
MSSPQRGELLRASLFHTPRNPFRTEKALESYADGGLLIRAGKVIACGEYSAIHAAHPDVPTSDLRGGFLLPGLVDTHIHFPQLRVLGGLGRELLDWLEHVALPEEARMADPAYACETARAFVNALAAHGTTTALVFGAHFAGATASLFEASEKSGLRIVSGMVLSDRRLRPDLHQLPADAYRESTDLIRRFHGKGRLLYAVTPRFALSTSEAMLEVCQTLLCEHPGVRFQTHLNENRQEIAEVAKLFPWAADYLSVYERFQLGGRGAVMAHNVHPNDSEVERLAASGTAISHCPSSNAALGSGLFSLRRHIAAGVTCALGTDVGGGTGFGRRHWVRHAQGRSAGIFAAETRDGWDFIEPRPSALSGHARGGGGAGPGGRNR